MSLHSPCRVPTGYEEYLHMIAYSPFKGTRKPGVKVQKACKVIIIEQFNDRVFTETQARTSGGGRVTELLLRN